jgi:hypothetical protein
VGSPIHESFVLRERLIFPQPWHGDSEIPGGNVGNAPGEGASVTNTHIPIFFFSVAERLSNGTVASSGGVRRTRRQ